MKDYLKTLLEPGEDTLVRRNIAREYLQARILSIMQRQGAMIPLAFHGGTALRFLFSHSRFSEDLDFALENHSADYDFRGILKAIQTDLSREGYRVEIKVNDSRTVHSAFIRFIGLMFELGLSDQPGEVLAVKLEVDTNPPAGATTTTTLVRRYEMLQLHHHDRASLLTGKIHALLQRPFTKGRDVYDLFWYLSDPNWPLPNFVMLNNALNQTGWSGGILTPQNWKQDLQSQLLNLNWKLVVDDVRPFAADHNQLAILNQENLISLLK